MKYFLFISLFSTPFFIHALPETKEDFIYSNIEAHRAYYQNELRKIGCKIVYLENIESKNEKCAFYSGCLEGIKSISMTRPDY